MQFPESWLRQWCNPPWSSEELAERLTMAGLEVEDIRPAAPPCSGVVVGEIRACAPHPNAERLRVCQVDVGAAEFLSIVCGAPNARVGLKTPCALVGAELPPAAGSSEALRIRQSKLRGVESQGMLCSARELGINDEHGGLLELAPDAQPGQDIRAHLQLDEKLFTLKLTPNLAHCLSIRGLAREVAAISGVPLQAPPLEPLAASMEETLEVQVDAPDLCGRFCGRVLRGLNARAATPAWMVQRLARCGQRSVSALVDISNYVMFELGQPTHMFDLDKIHGGLRVRWGRAGEQLQLLNGNTVVVDEGVGVIADGLQIESLAGIMGGQATAVSDDTTNVYMEAAFWWPEAVAGRSRRYNFSTEAGHRFERGVDPQAACGALERLSQLVLEICATPHTRLGPISDQQPNMPPQKQVTLRVARAAKVLGMPLTQARCSQALTSLGLPVQVQGEALQVSVPSWRFDLCIEEDLIEEVARIIGYDQLPATPPMAPVLPRLRAENRRSSFALRHALAHLGYQETINFSFVPTEWESQLAGNPQPLKLLNPIASQLAVMRSSLIGSLLQVLQFNADRQAQRLRIFELGRVFARDVRVLEGHHSVAGIAQPMRLAALAWGEAASPQWGRHWQQKVDFFDLKGDLESLLAPRRATFEVCADHPALHPGRCARVLLDGQLAGHIGELHPRWCQQWGFASAPQLFELELDALLARPLPQHAPISPYPQVQRDIAIVVQERVSHAQLMQALDGADTGGLLQSALLFDIFRPKAGAAPQGVLDGEKSLALRLSLGSGQSSLTEAQIEQAIQAVLRRLQADCAARLRG